MNFNDFKKNREKLANTINDLTTRDQKPTYTDERFWDVTKDATGNGEAIIRFLCQADVTKPPTIRLLKHSFKIKNRWFIEECPATISLPCPVCEKAAEVYAGRADNDRAPNPFYRKQKWVACILVVKDPGKPENNGKVKLFEFGKGINDKIMTAISPDSQLVEPINVFDFWEGCNFHLKVTKRVVSETEAWPNYDTSSFKEKSAIADKDSAIKQIFDDIIDLSEFIAPNKYKSYEDLQSKLNSILQIGGTNAPATPNKPTTNNRTQVAKEDPKKTDTKKESNEVDFDSLIDDSNDSSDDELNNESYSPEDENFEDTTDDSGSSDDEKMPWE